MQNATTKRRFGAGIQFFLMVLAVAGIGVGVLFIMDFSVTAWAIAGGLLAVFWLGSIAWAAHTGFFPFLKGKGVKQVRASVSDDAATLAAAPGPGSALWAKYVIELLLAILTIIVGWVIIQFGTRDAEGRTWFDRISGVRVVDTRQPIIVEVAPVVPRTSGQDVSMDQVFGLAPVAESVEPVDDDALSESDIAELYARRSPASAGSPMRAPAVPFQAPRAPFAASGAQPPMPPAPFGAPAEPFRHPQEVRMPNDPFQADRPHFAAAPAPQGAPQAPAPGALPPFLPGPNSMVNTGPIPAVPPVPFDAEPRPAPSVVPVAGSLISSVPWSSGRSIVPTPGSSRVSSSYSAGSAEATIARIPAGSIRLSFDDGSTYYLTDTVLVGRNPARDAVHADAILLPVADSTLTMSKTHAALTATNGAVIVEDLHSTNGSRIVLPNGQVQEVGTGQTLWAANGTTIELGSRRIRVGVGV